MHKNAQLDENNGDTGGNYSPPVNAEQALGRTFQLHSHFVYQYYRQGAREKQDLMSTSQIENRNYNDDDCR